MRNYDLTKDSILRSLIVLALPIMGTSFIQMAYNLIDLIWIGKLGPKATAAVGTAGFFMWLAMGFVTITKVAAESLVSRAVGKQDSTTNILVGHIIKLTIIISLLYSVVVFVFRHELIDFFRLDDFDVIEMSISYLTWIAVSYVLFFINPVFTSIFNAYGISRGPFLINMTGLVLNIILDPLLIFGVIGKPLGVVGAAIATIISQLFVSILFGFYIYRYRNTILFSHFKLFRALDIKTVKNIFVVGIPPGVQSMLFTFFAMVVARIIAEYGFIGITVQKIGSQIESLTWMTSLGFSVALSAFIGQNFGAEQYNRIQQGYWVAFKLMFALGIITTTLLVFAPKFIFSIFLTEPHVLTEGIIYLKILGYSQLLMCIEIVTNGAFYGLGDTMPPALNSIALNFLRIPLAMVLGKYMGLSGIWWAVSISSMLKGIVIFFWYLKKYSVIPPVSSVITQKKCKKQPS